MILSKKSVILTLISVLIASISGMGVFAYFPRYLLNLNINIILIQLILTFFMFTTVVFPPLLGKFSDNVQRRSIFFKIGAIGVNITFFILSFTFNLIFIIILLLIYGFFGAFATLKFVLFSELVESDNRFIAYFAAIMALGWFLGAFLCGIYVDIFGIEFFFQFLLIISLINTSVIIFIKENRSLIIERYENQNNKSLNNSNLIEQEEIAPISRSIYPSLFFRNLGVRPILIILAILMFFHLSSDTEIGFLIGINFLIQFFLNILIGHIITDKNLKWIMIIGYLLSAITIFGWIISTNFWSFLLFQILISLSFSMFSTATQIYISQNTTPKNRGKYMGFMSTSSQLGTFAGGLMFTLLLVVYSDYYTAMWFMVALPTVSALIILVKFESQSK